LTVTTDAALAGARPLRPVYGDLNGVRPGVFARELQLEAGSERLAVLRWEKVLGTAADAESGDGRWRIARRGPLAMQFVVRDAASDAEVATMTRNWRGRGEARFASGTGFKWDREGFWRSEHFWTSATGERLITWRTRIGWTTRYEMEVMEGARRLPELPVLVLLGTYVMVMMSRQRHAS
jgi:hypothetical protein